MADQAIPNSATPTPSGLVSTNPNGQSQPGGGAQFNVPEGYTLARKDEYDTFKRQAEQYNGVKPYWEKGNKYGLKSAEDWDRFGPVLETLNKRKEIDPRQLAAMLSAEADADLGGENKQPAFDPAKFEKEFESKWERKQAEREWRSQLDQEPKIYEAAAKQLQEEFPDVPPFLLQDAIRGRAEQIREMYEEGHPLHGQYLKAHGDGFTGKLSEFYKAEKAKYAGSQMAKKADDVLDTDKKPAPSAGKPGGNGPPTPTKRKPGQLASDAELERTYQQIKDERAAGMRR